MTDELVEIAALAMANEDARQVDCPILASVDEFRFDKDRDDYMARARAVLAAVTPAIEARVTGEIVAWLRRDDFIATADRIEHGDYKESQ